MTSLSHSRSMKGQQGAHGSLGLWDSESVTFPNPRILARHRYLWWRRETAFRSRASQPLSTISGYPLWRQVGHHHWRALTLQGT